MRKKEENTLQEVLDNTKSLDNIQKLALGMLVDGCNLIKGNLEVKNILEAIVGYLIVLTEQQNVSDKTFEAIMGKMIEIAKEE